MTRPKQNRPQGAMDHRLRRLRDNSASGPVPQESGLPGDEQSANAAIDCGWGRLVFAQTFDSPDEIAASMRNERPDRRDIAFYVRDPHVLLAAAPHELFLDPSHTYRLDLATYRPSRRSARGFLIRRLSARRDAEEVNTIYATRGMVTVPPEWFWERRDVRAVTVMVAEDAVTGRVIGSVTGVDHFRAFGDAEHGSSLWCLCVSPQAAPSGVGEMMVRRLAEQMQARGAAYLDLSVMHDNAEAIALYEKLGFRRVSTFTVKRRNMINEKLYTGPSQDEGLNPYAAIIVNEARRRGVDVDVIDAEGGFFRLTYGGRSIACRESLTDLTSGVAVSMCDDKALTRRIVSEAGVRAPAQIMLDRSDPSIPIGAELDEFLAQHPRVVVKPARGEQGKGIAVDLSQLGEIERAIAAAREVDSRVLIEEFVEGEDLRLVVIDHKVVAGAIRRPARITGDGQSTVRMLIERQSRRRMAATGGESRIPLDAETERCVIAAGFTLEDIPAEGQAFNVRRTANLHTGGTIHDVTGELHPRLIEAGVAASRALSIPVTGIDLMVRSPRQGDYAFIEANERPGLANHEPQPVVERFVDLMFPLSIPTAARQAQAELLKARA